MDSTPLQKYRCHFWSASTLDGWKNTSCWNHQSYYMYIYIYMVYTLIYIIIIIHLYKYVYIYIYTYIIYKFPPVVPWSSLKTSLKQRHLKAGHLHEVCFGCHRAARRPGWQTPHGSSYWTHLEIVDLPMKNGDVPLFHDYFIVMLSLPEGNAHSPPLPILDDVSSSPQ